MKLNHKSTEWLLYILVGVIVVALILLRLTHLAVFAWISVITPFVWLPFELIFNRCPHCGKYLGRQIGRYCRHCGKELEE